MSEGAAERTSYCASSATRDAAISEDAAERTSHCASSATHDAAISEGAAERTSYYASSASVEQGSHTARCASTPGGSNNGTETETTATEETTSCERRATTA